MSIFVAFAKQRFVRQCARAAPVLTIELKLTSVHGIHKWPKMDNKSTISSSVSSRCIPINQSNWSSLEGLSLRSLTCDHWPLATDQCDYEGTSGKGTREHKRIKWFSHLMPLQCALCPNKSTKLLLPGPYLAPKTWTSAIRMKNNYQDQFSALLFLLLLMLLLLLLMLLLLLLLLLVSFDQSWKLLLS